jgi:hypothetical protein
MVYFDPGKVSGPENGCIYMLLSGSGLQYLFACLLLFLLYTLVVISCCSCCIPWM